MPFGMSKKEKSADGDDASRSRLFGKKAKDGKSPAPSSSNPYAVQDNFGPDPYGKSSAAASFQSSQPSLAPINYGASSYAGSTKAPSVMSQQPPAYQNSYGVDPPRNDKSPVPSGGYGGARYGNQGSYGDQQGYGSDRFGSNGASSSTARPGGYGGLGRSKSQETMDTQAGKSALFGAAPQRYEQRVAQNNGLPPEDNPATGYGASGGGVPDMGYGTYQERELTAEEQEEEDVQGTKQQIRALKQEDVSRTRNALRIAEQAEATGRETLERLGAQGERIHNTEKNLDLASIQNRNAGDKARELKHLNRSMWAMQVGNPFTKGRRERQAEGEVMDRHHEERDVREATRREAYAAMQRKDEINRELRGPNAPPRKGNLQERSKYQFEADSEDEGMEDEIDSNLDALHRAAGTLHQVGQSIGMELNKQNEVIDRIAGKADNVDDGIRLNRSKLDRIK